MYCAFLFFLFMLPQLLWAQTQETGAELWVRIRKDELKVQDDQRLVRYIRGEVLVKDKPSQLEVLAQKLIALDIPVGSEGMIHFRPYLRKRDRPIGPFRMRNTNIANFSVEVTRILPFTDAGISGSITSSLYGITDTKFLEGSTRIEGPRIGLRLDANVLRTHLALRSDFVLPNTTGMDLSDWENGGVILSFELQIPLSDQVEVFSGGSIVDVERSSRKKNKQGFPQMAVGTHVIGAGIRVNLQ